MVKGGILDSVNQLLCPLGIQSGMPFLTIYLEGFEGVETLYLYIHMYRHVSLFAYLSAFYLSYIYFIYISI